MRLLRIILVTILLLVIVFFIWDKFTREDKVIEIPITIEVPVPVVEHSSDTIYKPYPVYINNPVNKKLLLENKELVDKFNESDSLLKLKQYQDAIAIKEYNQKFEDTFQTVNVYSKTRGELLSQSIHYKTKPYTIKKDTTVKINTKGKFKVYGLVEGGTNIIDENSFSKAVGKGTIIFKNSKDKGISVGFDTQGYGYLGYMFKF